MSGARVFVVDDDPMIVGVLQRTLERSDITVVGFDSAEHFLSRAEDHRFDACCLVVDIQMPGIGGLGLQEILNRDRIAIPLVFLSVVTDAGVIVQAMKAGAFDFLSKELAPRDIKSRVEQAIELSTKWRAERAIFQEYDALLALLSPQELLTLELLVEGRSTKEIGQTLRVCLPTVTRHKNRIFQKMQVRNVIDLARKAWTHEALARTGRSHRVSTPHFLTRDVSPVLSEKPCRNL